MIQPIDVYAGDELLKGRDAIWYCIRMLKTFSLADIEILSTDDIRTDNVNRDTARTYVHALEKGNYLERLPREQGLHTRVNWKLIKDVGLFPPRLDREGNPLPETKREQMWRAMKMLDVFDAHSLIATTDEKCGIKVNDAKDYIYHLHKAEYLVEVEASSKGGKLAKYRLIPTKNTGRHAPMVQRIKHVYDKNLNQVVWPKPQEETRC